MPSTNFNIAPYYDDYDVFKNFLRILFKPGVSVQARELTQLQTLLQTQIRSMGNFFFKNGSKVSGGDVSIDKDVISIKVTTSLPNVDLNFLENKFVYDTVDATVRAKIIKTSPSDGVNPKIIYIKVLGGAFSDIHNRLLKIEGETTELNIFKESISDKAINPASLAYITPGIFYINDFFAVINAQTIVLEPYSSYPTYRIGVDFAESIVDSNLDNTLRDPSTGSYNSNAPGADRFTITLTFNKHQIHDYNIKNFIEILRVDSGTLILNNKYPILSDLEQIMARRTYDESGDYTVRHFPIRVTDHQGSRGITRHYSIGRENPTIEGEGTYFLEDFEVNDVIYLSSDPNKLLKVTEVTNNTSMTVLYLDTTDTVRAIGDSTGAIQKIYNTFRNSIAIEAGKAYIKGFEFENISTKYIDLKKGRDFNEIRDQSVGMNYGNIIYVNNMVGLFNLGEHTTDPYELVDLHCCDIVDIDESGADKYNSTKIGTTRIRYIDYIGGSPAIGTNPDTSVYGLHVFDTQFISYSMFVSADITTITTAGRYVYNDSTDKTKLYLRSTHVNKQNVNGVVYAGMKIKITINGVDQTRNIVSYDKIIAADSETGIEEYILTLDYAFTNLSINADIVTTPDPTTASAPFTRVVDEFYFNAELIGETKDIKSIVTQSGYSLTKKATIDISSKTNPLDINSDTFIKNTDKSKLLFPYGYSNIRSLNPVNNGFGISFNRKKVFTVNSNAGVITLNSTGTDLAVSENFYAPVKYSGYLVFNAATGASLEISNIGLASNVLTITLADNSPLSCNVLCTLTVNNEAARSKTLIESNIDRNEGVSDNNRLQKGQIIIKDTTVLSSGIYSLQTPDCVSLKKVIITDGTVPNEDFPTDYILSTATGQINVSKDITNQFDFFSNQKDNIYGHSFISLKPSAPPPTDSIMIFFDFYEHGNGGYFSKESYAEEIPPNYESPLSGTTTALGDVLDFRIVQEQSTGTLATWSSKLSGGMHIPTPTVNCLVNLEYYRGRKDKLTLSKDRVFKVIDGISGDIPIMPPDDENSMTLYNLIIPPYTFFPKDVEIQYVDNKRYTMRDIGKLEKRLENVEYYTALSLLEKNAQNLSIKDTATGVERFKNGILVDSFSSHKIGDLADTNYNVSIDLLNKTLKPTFVSECYQFEVDPDNSTNYTKSGELVTLAFSEVPLITQNSFSDFSFINENSIGGYNGKLDLFDAVDVWYSKNKRPDSLINLEGQNDHWLYGRNNGFGLQWDDWSLMWTGIPINNDSLISERGITDTTVSRSTSLSSQNDTKGGFVNVNIPESIKKIIGDKIVNSSIVYYIRGQNLIFKAEGLKPLTTHYGFFDGIDVNEYIEPSATLTYTPSTIPSALGAVSVNRKADAFTILQIHDNTQQIISKALLIYSDASNMRLVNIEQKVTLSDWMLVTPVIGEILTFSSGATARLDQISEADTTIWISQIKLNSSSDTNLTLTDTISGSISGDWGAQTTVSYTGAWVQNVTSDSHTIVDESYQVIGTVLNNPIFKHTTDNLVSDSNGKLEGIFHVPDGMFNTGERLFRIVDDSQDSLLTAQSVSECLFRVSGLNETKMGDVISTRPLDIKRDDLSSNDLVATPLQRKSSSTNWINPLSQVFTISEITHKNGVFLKSVDLCFKTKDVSVNPASVSVQIRPVTTGGFPHLSNIIPFGESILNASDIITHDIPDLNNTTTTTHVAFDSPIYLTPGDYALVITSKSADYQLHTCTIGDLGNVGGSSSAVTISKLTELLHMFEAQNDSLWISQNKMLMFQLNRCDFVPDGSLLLNNINYPLSDTTDDFLYNVMKLTSSDLDFSETSLKYNFSATTESDGISSIQPVSKDNNYVFPEVYKVKSLSYTGTNRDNKDLLLNTLIKTNDSKISPVIDMSHLNMICVQQEINNGDITNDNIKQISGGAGYATPANVTATLTIGTNSYVLDTTITSGVIDSVTIPSNISIQNVWDDNVAITITDSSATPGTGANFILIDLENITGNNTTHYITKRVTLEDQFDAKDLKVFIKAYKHLNASIKLYYKVLNQNDLSDFSDRTWVLMNQETDASVNSQSENDFIEYTYTTVNNSAAYGSYTDFKTFAVKIVLAADTVLNTPLIKDLRVIALDS